MISRDTVARLVIVDAVELPVFRILLGQRWPATCTWHRRTEEAVELEDLLTFSTVEATR